MELKNLSTFVHVAELGSFSRAAERLGYSQPTISVQIRQLEEELGFRLFDRIGHAVRLTEKGHDTLLYAQQVCHICNQMTLADSGGAPRETLLRIATSDSLSGSLLQRCFSMIRKQHPGIRLTLLTAGTDDLLHLLDHNEADFICTLDSHVYNTSYRIAGEEKIGVHFVVGADHPLAAKAQLQKEDLPAQDFLLTEQGMSYRRLLDQHLAKYSLEIRPVLETGQANLICDLVRSGQGISFLPDYITEEAARGGHIKRLELEGFQPDLWKQILYHRDKWISPSMDAVIQSLTENWL